MPIRNEDAEITYLWTVTEESVKKGGAGGAPALAPDAVPVLSHKWLLETASSHVVLPMDNFLL